MRRSIPLLLSCLFVTACAAAEVPQTFDKHYPMQGRAELEAEIGNGTISTRSCGVCREIHLHLEMNGADRSRYRIEESQTGNRVRFVLKQDEDHHWNWNGNGGKGPELTVEVPQESALDLNSGNGNLSLSGVRGDLAMSTGNGSISIDDAAGQLRLHSGNGSVNGHNLAGTLNASTGNGSMHLGGRFSRLEVHTGNGSLDLQADGADGLRDGATITSGSGSVTLRLAHDARANLRLTTGSGGIHTDLPLSTQGDLGDRHDITAALNGGGATVRVTTGSGGIRLESL